MVNRNAARHLLFVVSILLCFFVYIGYRMRSSTAQGEQSAQQDTEFASYIPAPGSSSDSSSGLIQPLRPDDPIASLPSVISADDEPWIPSARGDDLALAPPSSPAASLKPPSSTPLPLPDTSSQSGVITGLVPALPQEIIQSDPLEDSYAGIPAFSTSGDLPGSGWSDSEGIPSSSSMPLPGAGLKPPGMSEPPLPSNSRDTGVPSGLIPPPPSGGVYLGSSASLPDESSASYGGGSSAPVYTPIPSSAVPGMTESSVSPVTPPIPPSGTTRPVAPARELASGTGTFRPPESTYTAPPVPVPPVSPITPVPRNDVPEPVRPDSEPSESLRIYLVRAGDTLSSIAAQELGSASLADNIFLLNRDVIADPDHLLIGIKIRLPIRDSGYGYGDGSAVTPPGAGRRPSYGLGRTHMVARGDTLSSIALRYYGSSSAWRFLYEANKNVVPNPNTLSVGTELTIPPYDN